MQNSDGKTMTEAERLELLTNFENFMIDNEKHRGWSEGRWQEELTKYSSFTKKVREPGQKQNPFLAGLQLDYDPNKMTPEVWAIDLKEDGNLNFKNKNYRVAIIAYTEAIKVKCGNPNIEATLYNNRSAANYFLKKYCTALKDAEMALMLKPDYDKAAIRAANCCYEIDEYEKAVEFCDGLLRKKPEDKEILQLKQKCINAMKTMERDSEKKKQHESKKDADDKLMKEILSRGIKIEGGLKTERLKEVPELYNSGVVLAEPGVLAWPVMIVFPEYHEIEFMSGVREDCIFRDYVEPIFKEYHHWDVDKKYIPSKIKVYFLNNNTGKVYEVDLDKTLLEILKRKQYIVREGLPTFIIVVKGSPAEKKFLKQYR